MISYYADPDLTRHLVDFQHRKEAGEPVEVWLAEGDSWFSLGGSTTNLLMALGERNDNRLIVSCAYPGDMVRGMSQLGNNPFHLMLSERFGQRWDRILLSAGGNDLLAGIAGVVSDAQIDVDRLDRALGRVELGYRRMIMDIRRHRQTARVYAHTYDYPTAQSRRVWWRSGPWVGPQLVAAGVRPENTSAVVREVIDGLARRVQVLHDERLLVCIDTRNILAPAQWGVLGWNRDWANEIHPSREGYTRLAARWLQEMYKQ